MMQKDLDVFQKARYLFLKPRYLFQKARHLFVGADYISPSQIRLFLLFPSKSAFSLCFPDFGGRSFTNERRLKGW